MATAKASGGCSVGKGGATARKKKQSTGSQQQCADSLK